MALVQHSWSPCKRGDWEEGTRGLHVRTAKTLQSWEWAQIALGAQRDQPQPHRLLALDLQPPGLREETSACIGSSMPCRDSAGDPHGALGPPWPWARAGGQLSCDAC